MARGISVLAGAAGARLASAARLSGNRRRALLVSCAVSWLVCYPFLGPLLALVVLLVPGLAFSRQLANLEFLQRNRAAVRDLRFSWSWRGVVAPESLLLAALLAAVTAATLCLVQPFPAVYRLGISVAQVGCYLVVVAACGLCFVRKDGRPHDDEASGSRVLERLLALGALAAAAGLGAFAWALRRLVLPLSYGESEPAGRWQPVATALAWLDGQVRASLAGPSFEQPYWPLLLAAAGLAAGLATLAAREAAVREATRIPFANEEPGTGGKVFLSYSRRDTEFARRVTDRLEGHVREIWVDWQAIKPSEKWRRSIADGIRESDAMVVLISRSSLASPYCWDEVRQAIEERKRILPVVIEPELATGTTAALRAAGWDELTEFQRLDMSRPERFEEDLRRIVAFTAQEHRWVSGHTRLGLQAHEWWESGRSDGFLLRADELRAAEWLRDHVPADPSFRAELTAQQQRFVEASRLVLRRRRVRLRTAVTSVLLVLAGLSSLVVVVQSQAESQRRQTLSRSLSAAAANQSGGRIDTSSLLAAAAYTTSDTAEARGAMADRLLRFNHAVKVLPGTGDTGAPVRDFAFGADGSVLAVELTNGTTQIWETDGWRLRGTLRGSLPVQGERGLSADGRLVALLDGIRVTVTDTTTMRPTASFELLLPGVSGGWFGGLSPDGRMLVGALESVAQIWSVPEQREVSQRPCAAMSLSPSGRWIWCQWENETWLRDLQAADVSHDVQLTGSEIIEGWSSADEPVVDVKGGSAEVIPAGGHGRPWTPDQGWTVQAVSEDGRHVLLYQNGSGRTAVWDLVGRTKAGDVDAAQLARDGKAVSGPDGDEQRAALMDTAPTDGMILSTGGERSSGVYSVHDRNYRDTAFTADGRRAAGLTASRALAVWDRGPGGRLVSRYPVGDLRAPFLFSAVSPDGNTVAVADDGDLRFFDTRSGRTVRAPIRLAGRGDAVAYSRDGSQLAVGELVGTGEPTGTSQPMGVVVEVFALPGGERRELLTSPSHADPREDVAGRLAFAPDGRRLYVGQQQAMAVFVWDLAAAKVVQRIDTGGSYLTGMALSPDGRSLATTEQNEDHPLRVWDTATGRQSWSQPGASGTITYSQDGRILLAPSPSDQSLTLWDARTHQKIGTDLDIGEDIRSAQVSSAAGTAVVSLGASSADQTVQLWDLRNHARIGSFLLHLGTTGPTPRLTADGTRAVAVADGVVYSVLVDPSAWKDSLCALAGRPLLRREWATAAPNRRYLPTC
ncbi:toll/interleukin-1 receptor domain-containing protein [Kitasatospora sp. NPDC056138]|uniref:toll/interleukin-1 receptor domain-containing protein n=1 Tax=Kitasatospora sp. NPDC056138 TaxID=3345724 RepID=UPI0035DEC086